MRSKRLGIRQSGFTIIELLVSIGIISLLLAITLPAIGSARESALEVRSLANLRSIGQSFAMHAAEKDEFLWSIWGWVVPPGDARGEINITFDIWSLERFWITQMHEYFSWSTGKQTLLSPGSRGRKWHKYYDDALTQPLPWPPHTSYLYSHSFVAPPANWTGEAEADKKCEARPVRPGDVVSPSGKVMVFDNDRYYLNRPDLTDRRPLLFADGSARVLHDADARAPALNRTTRVEPRLYHDTERGVAGVDF